MFLYCTFAHSQWSTKNDAVKVLHVYNIVHVAIEIKLQHLDFEMLGQRFDMCILDSKFNDQFCNIKPNISLADSPIRAAEWAQNHPT